MTETAKALFPRCQYVIDTRPPIIYLNLPNS
jgi:hypothetical protein